MKDPGKLDGVMFITWIFVSKLATVVTVGCPPPELLQNCKCEGVATLNCNNVTSIEDLSESIINEFVDAGVFDNILVNNTPITSLGNVFQIVKTKIFRITNNRDLVSVSEETFAGSEDTAESLIVSNNSISNEGVFGAISMLKNLRYLDLGRNRLEKIPDDAFVKSKQLKTAVLSYNEITRIGKRAFANLTNLEQLDLSHNKIYFIGEYCFFNLPQVRDIVLFENRLEKVGDYAFALGPSTNHDLQTTVIWLNRNELTEFWPKAFEGLARNAVIHMFNNRIMALPDRLYLPILEHFHSLNSDVLFPKGFMDLSDNAIRCNNCRMRWLVENPIYWRYAVGILFIFVCCAWR